ncbi:MAG: hypothetical protein ACE5JS_21345 [Nitrospinota bacterium]
MMANYQYSSDLIDDILFRAGELTDGTSDFNAVALTYLNRAYQALWMGGGAVVPSLNELWWWLRKYPPGTLILEPVIETGTVSVTNNNSAITFSSAPTKDLDNWFFKVDDHADIFRISAHTANATGATLDSVYTGDTDTAADYKAFKLEYDLATDLLKVISPMRAYQDGRSEIYGMDLRALEAQWPLRLANSGVPRAFAIVREKHDQASKTITVRFSHYGGTSSTDLIRVEYDYFFRPSVLTDSGSEEPVVPWEYRKLLSDVGLFFLHQDKDDNRAEGVGRLAQAGVRAMAQENLSRLVAMGKDFGRIKVWPEDRVKRLEPLRTETGLIVSG